MMICLDFHEFQIWVGMLLGASATLAIVVGYLGWRARK